MGSSLVAIGAALLAASVLGRLGRRIGLPTIPLFMLAGIHIIATLFFFPAQHLFDARPIITADHAVHYEQCLRSRAVFWSTPQTQPSVIKNRIRRIRSHAKSCVRPDRCGSPELPLRPWMPPILGSPAPIICSITL